MSAKYIVLGTNNVESAPVDQQTLVKWVENGIIGADSRVRNAMMTHWVSAKDLDFLSECLEKRMAEDDKHKSMGGKMLDAVRGGVEHHLGPVNENLSAIRRRYIPAIAPAPLRVCSALFDAVVVAFLSLPVLLFSLFLYNQLGVKGEIVFYMAFAGTLFTALLYLGVTAGVFAQTFGMWFWGLMLAKNGEAAAESYLFRTYAYVVLMLVFGILTPVLVSVAARRRSLHEMLSGTQVIRISAKPRA